VTPIQLWSKNRPLAHKIASGFSIPGSDRDDVIQEAMIGLWAAAQEYDPKRECSFRTFADLVIKRHLSSCIKAALRGKHAVLTRSVRDDDLAFVPHLHQVVDRYESQDELRRVVEAINSLDDWERHCVLSVASGFAYNDVGPPKLVDNTLCRARRKIKEEIAC